MNPRARRQSRYLLVQALYQWRLGANDPDVILQHTMAADNAKECDLEFLQEVMQQLPAQSTELDELMQAYLDRDSEDVSPIEHVILQMGCYELKNRIDVPYRVVINECVELAKKFGGSDSHKYINGVLDKLAQQLRPTEMG